MQLRSDRNRKDVHDGGREKSERAVHLGGGESGFKGNTDVMKISLSSNRAVFIRNWTERCCFFRTLWQESSPERCTRSLRSFLRTAQSSQSKFPCWRSTTRSCSTCSAPPRTSTSGCSSSTTLATRWRFRKCGCGFFFVSVSFLFLHT